MFKRFAFDDFEKKNSTNNAIFCNFSVIFDSWTFVNVSVYALYKLPRFLTHLTNFQTLCKVIVRLLLASAPSIKDVKRIKLDPDNILLFDYLEYVEINR